MRLVPLSFGRFGRWRCRLDFGSVFCCMSSSSFAVVRRLVLFRVRQNQVTKNLYSNSASQFRIFFFFLTFRLFCVCYVNRAFVFKTKSISVWRESEWVFLFSCSICYIFVFLFNHFCRLFENHQRKEKNALCECVVEFLSVVFVFFIFLRYFAYKVCVCVCTCIAGLGCRSILFEFFFECCKLYEFVQHNVLQCCRAGQ